MRRFNTKYQVFIGILILSLLVSCNTGSDEGIPMDEIINEDDVQIIDDESDVLNFSDSPIDLNNAEARFAGNIGYGPFEKNVFDIFLPNVEEPTALVILLHGGGFLGGNKSYFYTIQQNDTWNFPSEIRSILGNNIAVANINYRVLSEDDNEGIIKPLSDCKRALQYIRSISNILNIDKTKIVLYGVSAGAGASLWLNFSNDMADPSNENDIFHESTRVIGTVALETQATYDLTIWHSVIFEQYNVTFEELLAIDKNRVFSFYGVDSYDELFTPEIEAYRAQVEMLSFISPNDPEFWASNIIRPVVLPTNSGLVTHHAFHVEELKKIADINNVPNVSYYGTNPILYEDPSGESAVDFIIRKLND